MLKIDTSAPTGRFHAKLLELPDAGKNGSVLHLARSLTDAFRLAPDAAMRGIISWLDGDPIRNRDIGPFKQEELEHELSDYMAEANTEAFGDGRSKLEFETLANSDLPSAGSIVDFEGFCKVLKYIKQATSPPPSGFRARSIATARDRNGSYVVYPSPTYVLSQLGVIYEHWKRYRVIEPGFAAVVAMTALTNLHPFIDGNGRIARIVFNWTLNPSRANPVYLPIYELSALSRCGYLVRLRQAQYHSEWGPLFQFLLLCSERLFYDGGVNLISAQSP